MKGALTNYNWGKVKETGTLFLNTTNGETLTKKVNDLNEQMQK